jgi:hypothetical protein
LIVLTVEEQPLANPGKGGACGGSDLDAVVEQLLIPLGASRCDKQDPPDAAQGAYRSLNTPVVGHGSIEENAKARDSARHGVRSATLPGSVF